MIKYFEAYYLGVSTPFAIAAFIYVAQNIKLPSQLNRDRKNMKINELENCLRREI